MYKIIINHCHPSLNCTSELEYYEAMEEILKLTGLESRSSVENAELRARVVKLEQSINELKKELEYKKNCKFQKKCILIAQILLNEELVVVGQLDRYHRIVLEVQGAQHRLHSTSWFKLENSRILLIVIGKKEPCVNLTGFIFFEIWYDENPKITIPKRTYKFSEFIDFILINLYVAYTMT